MGGLLGTYKQEVTKSSVSTFISPWDIEPEIKRYSTATSWGSESISRRDNNPYRPSTYSSRHTDYRYRNTDAPSRYNMLDREINKRIYTRPSTNFESYNLDSSSDSDDDYRREKMSMRDSDIQKRVTNSTGSRRTFKESNNVLRPTENPISSRINYDSGRYNFDAGKIKPNENSLIFPQAKRYETYNRFDLKSKNYDSSSSEEDIAKNTTYRYRSTLDDSRQPKNIWNDSDSDSIMSPSEIHWYACNTATCNCRLNDIKTPEYKLKSTNKSPVFNLSPSNSSPDEWDARPNQIKTSFQYTRNSDSDRSDTQDVWDATQYKSHRPKSITLNHSTFQCSKNSDFSDTQDEWDASQFVIYNDQSDSSTELNVTENCSNSDRFSFLNASKNDSNFEKYSTTSNKTSHSLCPLNFSNAPKNNLNAKNNHKTNLKVSNIPIKLVTTHENSSFSQKNFDGSIVPNFNSENNCKKSESPQLETVKNMSHSLRSPFSNIQIDSKTKESKTVLKKCPVKRGMNRTKKISEGIVKKCLTLSWNCHKQLPMPESQLVNLPINHPEFLEIKRSIEMSVKIRKVLTVARVENPYQYCMYLLKKSELNHGDKKCIEVRQFHGTRTKNADSIVMNNFDWRLHGTNVGQRTGQGVSFSPLPSFASCYAKNVMFVVRVLVTELSLGDGNTILPENGSDTATRHDFKVIVKFDDCTFYPEYLVTLSPSVNRK